MWVYSSTDILKWLFMPKSIWYWLFKGTLLKLFLGNSCNLSVSVVWRSMIRWGADEVGSGTYFIKTNRVIPPKPTDKQSSYCRSYNEHGGVELSILVFLAQSSSLPVLEFIKFPFQCNKKESVEVLTLYFWSEWFAVIGTVFEICTA